MDPILNSYFLKFKSSFEISTASALPDEEKRSEEEKRKNADAFERFANYVLFSSDDPDVFTSNSDLLEIVSVGGAQDTGIDGLGIRLNGQLSHVGPPVSPDEINALADEMASVATGLGQLISDMTAAGLNKGSNEA